jgi:hypothetical protein
MATTGTVNTKLLGIYYENAPNTPVKITCQTNAELSINNEMFDVTCKDSGQWREVIPGQSTATLSGELFVAYDASNGHDEILTDAIAQNKLEWVFGTGVAGDTRLSGQGYFSSASISAPGQNEGVSMSFEITVTGAITQSTFS